MYETCSPLQAAADSAKEVACAPLLSSPLVFN